MGHMYASTVDVIICVDCSLYSWFDNNNKNLLYMVQLN